MQTDAIAEIRVASSTPTVALRSLHLGIIEAVGSLPQRSQCTINRRGFRVLRPLGKQHDGAQLQWRQPCARYSSAMHMPRVLRDILGLVA